ncbi:two-component system NtrC family response regulator [Desulfitispora alkaliphila]|uniref:sigma-54-dependent transcriptional regulator n=1 Tax=Desulfitispora alkaliphila TaxID=622674 RepID=UPI003D253DC7
MARPRVLVVDDEPEVLKFFSYLLEESNYRLQVASSGNKAKSLLDKNTFDLALLDLKLPDCSGLDILEYIKQGNSNCEVIIMTGYSTIKSAVKAIQLGALDYVNKPFEDIEQLEKLIEKAIQRSHRDRLLEENYQDVCKELGIVVGNNANFRELLKLAVKIATKDLSVLITGETGTGKDLLARFVHQCSSRRNGPFFALNCGAVVDTLLESELFGYEKGAFTGADQRRQGFFQLAHSGTLFLDEIGEASQAIQVKLLRILESGEFIPVGGREKLYSDVRIIAATNVDLETAVAQDKFRQDLYFRLDVVRLHIPPLRERKEDIPDLAHHILQTKVKNKGIDVKGFALKTMESLKDYHWPGNIRELINVVEQSAVVAEGSLILPKHLPKKIVRDYAYGESTNDNSAIELATKPITLAEMERQLIISTLERCRGNITNAAKDLGIGRNTLYRKMSKLNINES